MLHDSPVLAFELAEFVRGLPRVIETPLARQRLFELLGQWIEQGGCGPAMPWDRGQRRWPGRYQGGL